MRRPPICYARFFARVNRNPRKPGIQHYRQTSGIRGVGSHGDEEEGPSGIVQARLRVRSGSCRRKRDPERPSWRQRSEPGRDGTTGAAGAARFHHHDRGLHPFYDNKKSYPKGLREEVEVHLKGIKKKLGRTFGDPKNPLTVSVRSGARASMPGMMDTILNLGLNDKTVGGLAQVSKNPRFAWDRYRRFVAMYGDVVLELKPLDRRERDPFEVILEKKKPAYGVSLNTDAALRK